MFSIQELHPSRVSKHTIQQDLMLFEIDAMGVHALAEQGPYPSLSDGERYGTSFAYPDLSYFSTPE